MMIESGGGLEHLLGIESSKIALSSTIGNTGYSLYNIKKSLR